MGAMTNLPLTTGEKRKHSPNSICLPWLGLHRAVIFGYPLVALGMHVLLQADPTLVIDRMCRFHGFRGAALHSYKKGGANL